MKLKHTLMLALTLHVFNRHDANPSSPLNIYGCNSKGTITVRETNSTITCTGVARSKAVKWKLHFNNGTEIEIGMCDSQNCYNNLTNVRLKWEKDTARELVILNFPTSWNDALLQCTVTDPSTVATCRIILLIDEIMVSSHLPRSSTTTGEGHLASDSIRPSSTVALPPMTSPHFYWIIGCAILLVVIIFIIVSIIVYKKRKQRRNDDCYNILDIMGNKVKPPWPDQNYDHITLRQDSSRMTTN